ncbi:MAG: GNAT family N-acetyltransferase, partial [Syntrophomonadaceae bacterium]|nr:GNAT family N-acetyltransferase [Syntrophomonadaceae bacterium]
KGAINIHGALLPEYRGANPIQWAILNEENVTGVTMHYMTEQFDAGDIVAQRKVPIFFEDTWIDVQARIAEASEQMLKDEIPKLLEGTNLRHSQNETHARHFHRRYPEDGLIDWSQRVVQIYNLVRALVKPHPGAFYLRKDGTKEVLDKYLSIPSITSIKYAREGGGGQVLKSQHVALVPLAESNLPQMYTWINNQDSVLFTEPDKTVSDGQHQEWFSSIQQRNDLVIFGISLLEVDELIGSCQLNNINYVHSCAELQIRIGEENKRGKGYGQETVKLLLKYGFHDLNLNRIQLQVFSNNQVACHMFEKVGFKCEGVLRRAAHRDGSFIDVMVMGVLRDDYEQLE